MATRQEIQKWKGMTVVDADGDKIGTLDELYVDRQTGAPEWATVKTGLFGLKSSFVPIQGAEITDDNVIRVPVDKDVVKDAPRVDAGRELSEDEERRLYEYYGRGDYDEWQGDDKTAAMDDDLAPLATRDGGDGTAGDATGGDEAPAMVGVRLRRVVLVTVPPDDRS